MFAFFESLVKTTAPPDRGDPPAGLVAFYRHFLGEHRRLFVALFAVGLAVAVTDAMIPVFVGRLVTLAAAEDRVQALAGAWPMLLVMAVVIVLVRPLCTLFDLLLRNSAVIPGVTSRIRWLSHLQVMQQDWRFFQADLSGSLANRVMGTAGALRESAESAVRAVWYILMYGATTSTLLGAASPWLALPTLVWFAGYLWFLRHHVPRLRVRAAANAQAYSGLFGRIVDGYANILTLKLFASARHEHGHVREAVQRHDREQRAHMRSVTAFMFSLTLLNTALLAGTAGIGLVLWSQGVFGVGTLAMALPLAWQITNVAGWVAWEVVGIYENVASVQDGMQSLAAPRGLRDATDAQPLRVTRGEIRFDRVSFGYEGGPPVLAGLDLHIRPGERVGVVGRSGAGKSTLVGLLLRLFDAQAGRVLIDGQPLSAVTQESLRAAIGVVTQDTSLLHRSIGENIRIGRPEATDLELVSAARQARVHDFVERLVDDDGRRGYDASVGERGARLSGGQRQRVAIARVLLKGAPILVLDEATSALDSEAEEAIQEQLAGLMRGRTVIAIAHRLSTIASMDRLIVLDGGRVVEQGSHDALLARGGLYATLWRRQSGGFLGEDVAHTAREGAAGARPATPLSAADDASASHPFVKKEPIT